MAKPLSNKRSGVASDDRSDTKVSSLLLIATHRCNKKMLTRDYYIFNANAFGKFPKPLYHNWDFDGYCTSRGWVIYEFTDKTIRFENPFLSSGNQVSIPGFDDEEDRLCKACLSASPSSNPNDYILMATVTNKNVGYYTPTNAAWKFLLEGEDFKIQDIIYCRNMFYGINSKGAVCSFDLTGSDPTVLKVAPPIENNWDEKGMYYIRNISETDNTAQLIYYIVESCGVLLGVRRIWGWKGWEYYEDDFSISETPSMTVGFQVFKLDENTLEWIETDTLNGQSLFLGGNTSLSLLASDIPQCEPNCIYYTSFSYDGGKLPYYDMGYYRLEDRNIDQFYFGDDYANVYPDRNPAPMWLERTIAENPGNIAKDQAKVEGVPIISRKSKRSNF